MSYNYNWNKDKNLNAQKYAITTGTFDKEINYQHKANYNVTLIKCVFQLTQLVKSLMVE